MLRNSIIAALLYLATTPAFTQEVTVSTNLPGLIRQCRISVKKRSQIYTYRAKSADCGGKRPLFCDFVAKLFGWNENISYFCI